jgi:hypothetical protein
MIGCFISVAYMISPRFVETQDGDVATRATARTQRLSSHLPHSSLVCKAKFRRMTWEDHMLLEGNISQRDNSWIIFFWSYWPLVLKWEVVLDCKAELICFSLLYSAVRMLLLVQSTMLVMVERIWESMRTTQSSTHMD